MATYSDPIGSGLSPERVDQGVDYGGSGPLYALGAGTITETANAGWPGGTYIGLHLNSGNYVYYAEDIAPSVKVGQSVQAGQQIGRATGGSSGIEVGWAEPPGVGNTMAQQANQIAAGLKQGDPGAFPTAYGVDMSKLISSLGGPAGKISGAIQGSVPAGFDTAVTGTTAQTASFNILNPASWIPGVASSVASSLNPVKWIEDALGISNFKDILMRMGLLLLGGIFIIVGIFVLVGKQHVLTAAEGGAAIAAPEAAPAIAAEHQERTMGQ